MIADRAVTQAGTVEVTKSLAKTGVTSALMRTILRETGLARRFVFQRGQRLSIQQFGHLRFVADPTVSGVAQGIAQAFGCRHFRRQIHDGHFEVTGGDVAARPDLQVHARHRGRMVGQHLHRVLRVDELDQAFLADRVDALSNRRVKQRRIQARRAATTAGSRAPSR